MIDRVYGQDHLHQPQPEKLPFTKFELRAKEVRDVDGNISWVDQEIALIHVPGSKDLVEKEVDDKLRQRYGAYYQAWKDGNEAPVNGTDLRNWPLITPAQIEICKSINVRSVEDLRDANEEALKRIGMGARSLKDKAKVFLEAQKGSGVLASEMDALRTRLENMEADREELDKKAAKVADSEKMAARIAELEAENTRLKTTKTLKLASK